jgi:hypothetical protein
MQHLQLPEMAEGSGSPDWVCIFYNRTDELLIKQHTETVIYRPLLIFKREPSTPSL